MGYFALLKYGMLRLLVMREKEEIAKRKGQVTVKMQKRWTTHWSAGPKPHLGAPKPLLLSAGLLHLSLESGCLAFPNLETEHSQCQFVSFPLTEKSWPLHPGWGQQWAQHGQLFWWLQAVGPPLGCPYNLDLSICISLGCFNSGSFFPWAMPKTSPGQIHLLAVPVAQ